MEPFNELSLTLSWYFSKTSNKVHYHGSDTGILFVRQLYEEGEIVEYEAPDMYITDGKNVILIEHFEFDCFKNNRKGSTARQEENQIERKKDRFPLSLEGNVFHDVITAESGYDYYITNVKTSFEKHYNRISTYKENLKEKGIIKKDSNVKVMFVIDDTSLLGSSWLDQDKKWRPVFLAHSKEFLDLLKEHPEVNYILSTSCSDRHKFIWFIDADNLDDYYENIENYTCENFVKLKPHVIEVRTPH